MLQFNSRSLSVRNPRNSVTKHPLFPGNTLAPASRNNVARYTIHLHGFYWKINEMDGLQVPEAAQQLGNTVLVAVGQTKTVEFIADNPGDWAMHCHMTHHTMNQMGHNAPNLIGVRPGKLDKRVSKLLPGYMAMGESGMADMGEMGMPVPRNSIPMVGVPGKHDYIDMGGMFTIVKVRENLTSYDDPGWYENPS